MSINLMGLFEEFPKPQVSWRAQTVTKDGTKALALAYVDARDVMDRLDEVCGIDGWQCKYSHANGKTICDVGIKCGDEWIWKADGAGDTDVEADKGAISDAFKRAAVKWGVARYLYDLGQTWVPCSSIEFNGKKKFKEFTDDPWKHVKATTGVSYASKKRKEATLLSLARNAASPSKFLSENKHAVLSFKDSAPEPDLAMVTIVKELINPFIILMEISDDPAELCGQESVYLDTCKKYYELGYKQLLAASKERKLALEKLNE
jgi:hypothetical protein